MLDARKATPISANLTDERLNQPTGDARDCHQVDAVPQLDISHILAFTDSGCGLCEAFTHLLGRYVQHGIDAAVLRACSVAWALHCARWSIGGEAWRATRKQAIE